ncbi:lipopolysaccharide-induced tumor necrosis factor-alpha factor homolog [Phlebotomus argentipes]|uniref:lipopolysaccharide-induced tumor necrosis factor-alpha factor homolog n=1 Tax=Phlebotomus argentipes TaxID=94469 RepID=UPI002892AE62|nr:lipopolysaccharide-induced tumor necrosis factor-alpha factor homolog [Phlebotomus argentipes]
MEQKSMYPHPDPNQAEGSAYPHQMQYPPPQYPMPQPEMQYAPPPIVTQPTTTIIMPPQVGPDPTMITCPSCHSTVVTRMEYEPNTRTHICALLLCVFCCWPCVCVPYCVDSCQSGNHYCPSCGAYVGTYEN